MKKRFVILTIEQAASIRRALASPVHSEWLRKKITTPTDLEELGLSGEQIAAIQKITNNSEMP